MARGFRETDSYLARLPDEVRGRVGYLLAELSMEVSAAQKAAVPTSTGFLARGIDAEVMLEQLRMRAGLLALQKGKKSNRYYGRFVEFGRRAQSVRVTRGTTVSARSASTRRRLKKGLTVRKPYTMRVRAMAARPFIAIPGIEARIERRAAQFWSEVLPL